jgi:hypothetical protein
LWEYEDQVDEYCNNSSALAVEPCDLLLKMHCDKEDDDNNINT